MVFCSADVESDADRQLCSVESPLRHLEGLARPSLNSSHSPLISFSSNGPFPGYPCVAYNVPCSSIGYSTVSQFEATPVEFTTGVVCSSNPSVNYSSQSPSTIGRRIPSVIYKGSSSTPYSSLPRSRASLPPNNAATTSIGTIIPQAQLSYTNPRVSYQPYGNPPHAVIPSQIPYDGTVQGESVSYQPVENSHRKTMDRLNTGGSSNTQPTSTYTGYTLDSSNLNANDVQTPNRTNISRTFTPNTQSSTFDTTNSLLRGGSYPSNNQKPNGPLYNPCQSRTNTQDLNNSTNSSLDFREAIDTVPESNRNAVPTDNRIPRSSNYSVRSSPKYSNENSSSLSSQVCSSNTDELGHTTNVERKDTMSVIKPVSSQTTPHPRSATNEINGIAATSSNNLPVGNIAQTHVNNSRIETKHLDKTVHNFSRNSDSISRIRQNSVGQSDRNIGSRISAQCSDKRDIGRETIAGRVSDRNTSRLSEPNCDAKSIILVSSENLVGIANDVNVSNLSVDGIRLNDIKPHELVESFADSTCTDSSDSAIADLDSNPNLSGGDSSVPSDGSGKNQELLTQISEDLDYLLNAQEDFSSLSLKKRKNKADKVSSPGRKNSGSSVKMSPRRNLASAAATGTASGQIGHCSPSFVGNKPKDTSRIL